MIIYVTERTKVLIDDNEVGCIMVEDVDSVFFQDMAGNIYSSGELRNIAKKVEEIEKEVT